MPSSTHASPDIPSLSIHINRQDMNRNLLITAALFLCLTAATILSACHRGSKQGDTDSTASTLPYSGEDTQEKVYEEYGNRTIRLVKDESISHPEMMKQREICFIVMSKKDYYLYV